MPRTLGADLIYNILMSMDVQQIRELLPVTQDFIYMNTGWSGPAPTTTTKRISEIIEEEARLGPASDKGVELGREVNKEAIATVSSMMNANKGEITLTHSTREGLNAVLYGMTWNNNDHILICDLEHPALTIPAAVLEQRYGVGVNSIHLDPTSSLDEILESIKSALTPKTKLVALSHIQYTCGLKMPIKEICYETNQLGIPVLIDGAQTFGQIAIDVKDLGCDFYAVPGQKWIMGPVGTGALYVKDSIQDTIEPIFSTNQIQSKRNPERIPISKLSLVSNNPGLVAGFTESLKLVSGIGISNIEKRAMALSSLLRETVEQSDGVNLLSTSESESACGLVTIGVNNWSPEDLVGILQKDYKIVGRTVHGPDGVRFSTHYFNTEQEVYRVVEVLSILAKE